MDQHLLERREDRFATQEDAVRALTNVDAGLPPLTPVNRIRKRAERTQIMGRGMPGAEEDLCGDTGVSPVRAMSARARRPCHGERVSSDSPLRPLRLGGGISERNEPNRTQAKTSFLRNGLGNVLSRRARRRRNEAKVRQAGRPKNWVMDA